MQLSFTCGLCRISQRDLRARTTFCSVDCKRKQRKELDGFYFSDHIHFFFAQTKRLNRNVQNSITDLAQADSSSVLQHNK